MRRFWIVLAVVISGVVAFGIYGQAAQSHALDDQISRLTQENAALQQQISDRQREIVEAQTSSWLEEEARKLGYVFPGEKVFVLTGPGAAAPSGGVSAPLPSFSPLPTPTLAATPSASASPSLTASPHASPTPVPLVVPHSTPSPSPRSTPPRR